MGVTIVAIAALFALLIALMIVERLRPVRRFEEVPGWRLKCVAFMPLVIGVSAAVPYVLATVISGVKLLPGDRLGVVGGTLVGIVFSELVVYWAHRLHHRNPLTGPQVNREDGRWRHGSCGIRCRFAGGATRGDKQRNWNATGVHAHDYTVGTMMGQSQPSPSRYHIVIDAADRGHRLRPPIRE